MKTIVNHIQLAIANDVTLIHDVKKNKLYDVKYDHTIIDLEGNAEHTFFNNGKAIKVSESDGRYRMYKSRLTFQEENQIDMTNLYLDGSKTRKHFRFVCQEDRENIDVVAVSFVEGVPTEVDAPLTGFLCNVERHYIRIEPIFDTKVNINEYYDSVESATSFHSFKVTNIEGEEEEVEGKLSYILPTDEQQKVVDELREVLNKAKEVGLGLMLNCSYGRFHAYNAKKACIDYDCDGESLNDIEPILPESIKLPNGIYDYNDDSCHRIYKIEEKA